MTESRASSCWVMIWFGLPITPTTQDWSWKGFKLNLEFLSKELSPFDALWEKSD